MMRTEDFRLPSHWKLRHQDGLVATYGNEADEMLSLNYFPKVPDIAADVSDARALRTFYRAAAESGQVAMLEVDPARLAGLPAVRTILKARLEPRGFAFIGSYTLPFSDHSFVIKIQCVERGITGIREAAVMLMEPSAIEVDEATGKLVGWEQDPYEPSHRSAFMRSQADDPKYDTAFPDHPLSKVRHYLREIASELEVSPSVSSARPFKYKSRGTSIWSWLWR
jgi:hypothetical protein